MYFITVFKDIDETFGHQSSDRRCVGYFEKFDEACQAITNNYQDIDECYYNYGVIEKINFGIYQYASSNERWFFRYNKIKNMFDPINEPDDLEHSCGFAIG